jgi:hypothetical protein
MGGACEGFVLPRPRLPLLAPTPTQHPAAHPAAMGIWLSFTPRNRMPIVGLATLNSCAG